jgi:hypothetical protein
MQVAVWFQGHVVVTGTVRCAVPFAFKAAGADCRHGTGSAEDAHVLVDSAGGSQGSAGMHALAVKTLAPDPDDHVLEMGCGPGVAVSLIGEKRLAGRSW